MERKKQIEPTNIKGVVVDGVELINQKQAAQLAGVTLPTFRKKVALFNIERIYPTGKQHLYRRKDIESAIENNWFSNMWC